MCITTKALHVNLFIISSLLYSISFFPYTISCLKQFSWEAALLEENWDSPSTPFVHHNYETPFAWLTSCRIMWPPTGHSSLSWLNVRIQKIENRVLLKLKILFFSILVKGRANYSDLSNICDVRSHRNNSTWSDRRSCWGEVDRLLPNATTATTTTLLISSLLHSNLLLLIIISSSSKTWSRLESLLSAVRISLSLLLSALCECWRFYFALPVL